MEKKAQEAREIKEKAEKTPKQNKKPDSTDSSKKKQGNMSPKPLDVSITTPSSSKMKDRVGKTSDNERKRKSKDVESRVHHKKAKKILKTKPFTRLLDDVVLVISGIQNPDRANLRTSALAMGAKYKPDWDTTSTHLICAFANTPKFNQVKGKGKIVTRKWVEDCYSQRKRLPWRRYALDKADAAKNESEDEICEEIKGNSPPQERADNDSEGDYNEGSDTEERIVRIQELQRLKEQKRENNLYISDTDDEGVLQNKNNKANSVYSADTDEEEKPEKQPPSASQNMNKLKSLFLNKKFYIDYTFSENVYNKLRKYIVAYNGKSVDDPTEDVDVILTSKENSGSLKEINSSAVCLNPDWVWDCHNCQNQCHFLICRLHGIGPYQEDWRPEGTPMKNARRYTDPRDGGCRPRCKTFHGSEHNRKTARFFGRERIAAAALFRSGFFRRRRYYGIFTNFSRGRSAFYLPLRETKFRVGTHGFANVIAEIRCHRDDCQTAQANVRFCHFSNAGAL
ncbi:hypothetical protein NQ318_005274 [Aromia moschata]|uniref:BRCT domain-containing protein n=1 Tax=Aromia moschata TaxID=1265417 RepID=A0AAV8Y3N6_9CUCU|nr:hypothetical protein NQ318_005274 [Aromia moschata]